MIVDTKFPPGTIGAYALSNSGTLSRFHHTSNPYAAPVAWQDTDLDGIFNRIVPELNGLNVYVQGELPAIVNPADNWDLSSNIGGGGTIVDRTNTTITVSSTNIGGPRQSLELSSLGDINDCAKVTYEIISGGYTDFVDWIDCGVARTIPNIHFGFLNGQCVNSVLAYTDVSGPFTIKFTFVLDDLCGDPLPSNLVVTQYSTNSGSNFDPIKIVGVLPSGGMDTIKIGTTALAGAGTQVYKTTSGGDWSLYSGTLPTGAQPTAIHIPRWQFGGTVTPNINTSTPQYLLGSGTLSASGESLWKVTGAGSIFTAISPKINGTAGLIVGPNALNMEWNSGTDISAIANFNGSVKLCISTNTGAGWKFTSLDDGALGVVSRRSDLQHKQVFIANGGVGGYVPDLHLGTVVNTDKHSPASSFNAIDVYN